MVFDAGKICSYISLPFAGLTRLALTRRDLARQEHGDVPDEEFGILVLRAVIGVGVQNQLRVRDVLLQGERV